MRNRVEVRVPVVFEDVIEEPNLDRGVCGEPPSQSANPATARVGDGTKWAVRVGAGDA
jgi:hypothetical protein